MLFADDLYDALLPDHLPSERIACMDLLEQNDASSIYRIETIDGEVHYQVISVVVTTVLPATIELVCLAAIKNPSLCKYVYYAGEALIAMYGEKLTQRVADFWSTRIVGTNGIAKVFTSSLSDAKGAHQAFKTSKDETGYPWSAPVTEVYRDMNFGY
jgi:hypothetical protein